MIFVRHSSSIPIHELFIERTQTGWTNCLNWEYTSYWEGRTCIDRVPPYKVVDWDHSRESSARLNWSMLYSVTDEELHSPRHRFLALGDPSSSSTQIYQRPRAVAPNSHSERSRVDIPVRNTYRNNNSRPWARLCPYRPDRFVVPSTARLVPHHIDSRGVDTTLVTTNARSDKIKPSGSYTRSCRTRTRLQ